VETDASYVGNALARGFDDQCGLQYLAALAAPHKDVGFP
jgi:hypothetical protein